MINTTIGKYKITRLIGEGGMASVYEAEHEMLGTKVAIKVLNPMLSANAQIKERFRNEAKLMASLDHPNITKVIDFDEQPQQLSIVIEYLNGEDLNQNIKRNGPLSEKEITDVFSQTLSAFQYAHEKGIVHRDIKPSNIFILPNGHVKILDFGIAKLFGQGNEMTHTGTQMGTPIYMSPEQVKADKSIDHRSDIYSLGVTLFFVINGKPPYNSDTDSQFDIFNKIVYEPLPEFSIQSKFKDIVLKACQKNREVRYQGCDDILSKLNLKGIIKSEEKTIVNNTSKSHLQHDKTVLAEKSINNYDNQSAHPKAKKEPIGEVDIIEKAVLSFGVAFALILIGIILFGLSDGAEEGSVNGVLEQVQAQQTSGLISGVLNQTDAPKEVTIGTQVWITKNLNVDKFRNGDPIPQLKLTEDWEKALLNEQPGWCYYDNDPANGEKYGKLYNWYAVNDPRGLAPKGWHVPSDEEWSVLTDYLGGEDGAGTKMKSKSGWEQNGNGTNESGFSGLPGGLRNYNGPFNSIGRFGLWWSSMQENTYSAWFRYLYYDSGLVLSYYYDKEKGLSVRCLRD